MNWQDFFKLTVTSRSKIFFEAQLKTPTQFAFHELMISRFEHLQMNAIEKKKLSLGLRKILVCHDLFDTKAFHQICQQFRNKIIQSPENEFSFHTEGGGIYLFLKLLNEPALKHKRIICYTSELPLPIMQLQAHANIQFIYTPQKQSYLADFSTLWKETELMELFELKDFKASA